MRRPIFLFLALGAGCWLWHRASVVESPPVVAGAQGVKPRVAAEVPQAVRAVAGPALLANTVTQKAAAVHPLLAMRQDVRWEQPVAEPEFADFKQWAETWEAGAATEADVAVGVRLAEERRAALRDLMARDPRRALELAVPVAVRRGLPGAVQALLEERISGRGDLEVMAAVAMPGRESEVVPVTRAVRLDGREYETYTWGRRESAMSAGGAWHRAGWAAGAE